MTKSSTIFRSIFVFALE